MKTCFSISLNRAFFIVMGGFSRAAMAGVSHKISNKTGVEMGNNKMGPFAWGEINPYRKYFQGQSYLNMLTKSELPIGNVTFEPASRNNWHIHHADKNGGQILLWTYGRGWYQEWGKPARELYEGDVVVIPQGVKHWHRAAKDSWFMHLAVELPGENAYTEWFEPVSDDDYAKLP